LSDAVDHGITVTEIAAMDQPVDVCPETTAAFVGRALRGPLNSPVLVANFGEFRRRFGDVWGRSSLGPAAKQFFDHGGKRLYVIRVANNARGAMLCLPASGSALVLRAVEPGSTEFIRAAVDYDGIEDDGGDLFNLTLQRVNPAVGTVIEQEFFRKLSWEEDSDTFVADELLTSGIAGVEQPYPTHRPERTTASGRSYESTYIDHAQAGTDGTELSNYDLIGSRRERSGLFALQHIEHFDLLYLPATGKGRDAGPAAILAAELYCRERGAMLVVDPSAQWSTAREAVDGVRDLGYASPNLLGYFPRVRERGSDADVTRPIGGAVAGLLCKQDRTYGPWQSLDQQGLGLHRWLRPEHELSDEDQLLLRRAGLNVLVNASIGKSRLTGSVTMGRGSEAYAEFSKLPVRRFCLQIINTIAKATRWAVFESEDDTLATRLHSQVLTYLHCLDDLGAFVDDNFVVQCDAGVSNRSDSEEHGVTILLVFHPVGCDEPISLTLHQTASGFRVGSTAFGLTIRRSPS
jgi:Bacteriophage tail sheath protein